MGKITYTGRLLQLDLPQSSLTINDILKIIRSLNVNKAHGQNGIMIRPIKIRDKSLVQPVSGVVLILWCIS